MSDEPEFPEGSAELRDRVDQHLNGPEDSAFVKGCVGGVLLFTAIMLLAYAVMWAFDGF